MSNNVNVTTLMIGMVSANAVLLATLFSIAVSHFNGNHPAEQIARLLSVEAFRSE